MNGGFSNSGPGMPPTWAPVGAVRPRPASIAHILDLADLLHTAAATPRQASTSASPEEVEMVIQLEQICRAVTEHGRRVMVGEGGRWGRLGDVFAAVTAACRDLERLAMDDDAGDAGGR